MLYHQFKKKNRLTKKEKNEKVLGPFRNVSEPLYFKPLDYRPVREA